MSEPAGKRVPVSDEQILLAALYREPGAWANLTARLNPFLWSIARRRLADLPADIQAEFHQEVWMRVASRAPEDFDPDTTSGRDFVSQFASAAINKVRADYCPPGQRTRDRAARQNFVPLADIGLLHDARAAATFEEVAARVDLERLLAVAGAAVRRGLESMRDEDLSTAAAARRIGMARETYRRKVLDLPALLREATRLRERHATD